MEKPNLEGKFKKIPFDEAYKQIHKYQEQKEELEAQGAIKGGNKEIDKKYVALLNKTVSYSLQFSEEELYLIIEKIEKIIQDKKEK